MSRKYVVFLATLLFLTSNCFGQSGWYWINPVPSNNTGYDIGSINGNTVFLATDYCGIFKSTDFGSSWLQGNCQTFNNYESIQFLNSTTGFAGGNYTVVKTTDSGSNWHSISTAPNGVTKIYFINENTGYLLSYTGYLYYSSDGGVNWTFMYTGYWIRDFYIWNPNSIICVSDRNILKSTNSGANWTIQTEVTGTFLTSVLFSDANTGIVAGNDPNYHAFILYTTNGGASWLPNTLAPAGKIVKVQFVNNSTVYALSEKGYFLSSSNSGANWSQSQFDQSNASNYCMNFINSSTGFIDGYLGRLFKTTNSGINWTFITQGLTTEFRDVDFVNSFTGFVAGYGSTILKTTNAGNNWTSIVLGNNYKINSICFVSANSGFAVCDSGKIYKTVNSGVNWNLNFANSGSTINKVSFLNGSTGLVGGVNGYLAKTTNGGINWNQLNLANNAVVYGICFAGSSTAYIALGNSIYKSTNSGDNWFNTASLSIDNISDVSFANVDTGSAVGIIFHYPAFTFDIIVYTTFDGGATWNITSNIQGQPSPLLKYVNSRNGYFIDWNIFYWTTNSGLNWIPKMVLPSIYGTYGSFFLDSINGYVVGGNGTILKTTDGGGNLITSFNQIETSSPNFYSLIQNYPNPFNPQTKIKFEISKQSYAKLIIYDILGREVATLVNEELKPGTYSFDWDGSNYASGIYFYQLVAGDYVQTKRMVLLK